MLKKCIIEELENGETSVLYFSREYDKDEWIEVTDPEVLITDFDPRFPVNAQKRAFMKKRELIRRAKRDG